MYSITELFIFSVVLSLAACIIGYKHGRKKGQREGYLRGNKDTVVALCAELAAADIGFKVVDSATCTCPVCVAERAAKKP